MKIALIRDSHVENIILSSLWFAQLLGYDAAIDVTGMDVAIGDTYENGTFSRP